ncbi:MAG: DDE-type integrase/transposase/recombinase [Kofleriaceae bacterium]
MTAPNGVWVADLTYLRTQTGFVYLAVVLDLFARRVVGWQVSRDGDAGVAVGALQRALALRPAPAGLVHHSDRGVRSAWPRTSRAFERTRCLPRSARPRLWPRAGRTSGSFT